MSSYDGLELNPNKTPSDPEFPRDPNTIPGTDPMDDPAENPRDPNPNNDPANPPLKTTL